MRFIAKMESKSLAATTSARSACCKGAANPPHHHIAQHIEDHDVGFFEQVVLFQQLHGLPDHISAAAGACRRPARLDAHDPVIAFEHVIFGPQFLGVEFDRFQHVDHRRHQLLGEGEGAVMLGIAADLEHLVAEFGERGRKVRRGGRLADPALAVDSKTPLRP